MQHICYYGIWNVYSVYLFDTARTRTRSITHGGLRLRGSCFSSHAESRPSFFLLSFSSLLLLFVSFFSFIRFDLSTVLPARSSRSQSSSHPSSQPGAMAELQGRKVFKVFNQDFIVNENYNVTKELGQGAYGIVW